MDSTCFDNLTRRVAAARSRRDLLRGLATATVAGSLALHGLTEAKAKRRRRKRKNKRRRGGSNCSPACGGGMLCVSGDCVTGQGTCETGDDSCDEFVYCTGRQSDDHCQCQLSIEGETRCVHSTGLEGSACGDCASNAECTRDFPDIPGVICVRGACCSLVTGGFCARPCPPAPGCSTPEDCRDALNACQVRTCEGGRCGRTFVAEGTELPPATQNDGDCQLLVCDGNGNIRSEVDDTDLPCCFECFTSTCANGTPVHTPDPEGTPCIDQGQDGLCDGAGHCVV
jgi:hypothetical protein